MNILLTGGRAPASLELARVFTSAGHRVVMAESLPAHLSQPSRAVRRNYQVPPPRQQPRAFIDALIRVARDEHIDCLIPTCEEVYTVAAGREALSEHCTVFTGPLDQLRRLHHKALFVERAREAGLPVPETILLQTPDDLPAAFERLGRIVLKPAYSRFASRTIIDPPRSFAAHALPVTPAAPWAAQHYLQGTPLCSYSVAHDGRLTAHTVYESIFTAGQGATIHFRHRNHPGIWEWVSRFVEVERFTGQIAFDFIETPDGSLYAIECNPRATSGVHLLAGAPGFAHTLLDPDAPLVTAAGVPPVMLASAMLIYGLPAALWKRRLHRWTAEMIRSRDAVFAWHDPLPALLQGRSILRFLLDGWQQGISPLEASTADIEWNGEDILPVNSVGK